ncbi:MAG: sugar ABC transporter permease [Thermomicrobiales bacterium]
MARPDSFGTGHSSRWSKYRLPMLYIAPAMAVLAVVTLYPIGYQIYNYEFFRARSPRKSVRLACGTTSDCCGTRVHRFNFRRWRILAFISLDHRQRLFHVVIGHADAVLLNRKRILRSQSSSGRRLSSLGHAPPLVVATVAQHVRRQFRAINLLLKELGFSGSIDWLQRNDTADCVSFVSASGVLRCANIWLGWPFMMIITTGALQSIPGDLYEAAHVDGATRWQRFWDITAPLIRPAMVPAIMCGTILHIQPVQCHLLHHGWRTAGENRDSGDQSFKLINGSVRPDLPQPSTS